MNGELAGRVFGGKYRLDRVLGQGGMGTVWRAEHVELGSPVALKVMAPALAGDAAARARFRREARAAARLRHPHVVLVHDFGEHERAPYLVMELLQGETLQQELDREGRLQPARVAELVRQAADALGAAHAEGIVHRDVKPSNLFVCPDQDGPTLKILDFGIARAALDDEGGSVTRSGVIIGSPAFMSPEQASGDPVNHTGDLWSLGAVAYRMLTGAEPFGGRTVTETLARIRAGKFKSPSLLVGELPRRLDAFFVRAFALDAEKRFATAEEFGSAFLAAADEARAPAALGRDHTTQILSVDRSKTRSARIVLAVVLGAGLALAWFAWRAPPRAAPSREASTKAAPPPRVAPQVAPAVTSLQASEPSAREPPSDVATPPAQVDMAPGARRRSKSKLTDPSRFDTPAKSSATTDPLFGLPVKSASGSVAAPLDAGAVRKP